MLKLTFLGTSGSAPTVERALPAVAIQYEGDLLLWDAGEGTQRQLMKYAVGYGSIDAVFISHAHLDHYLGLFGLLETLNLAHSRRELNVYGYEDFAWVQERYSFVKFHKVKKGALYKRKDYTVSAFPVKHSKNSHGFVLQENERVKFHEEKAHKLGLQGKMFTEIQQKGFVQVKGKKIKLADVTWTKPGRKIVYSGDCRPCSALTEAAQDADVLIHEATFDGEKAVEAKERLHSTMEDAAELARTAKVKQLVLTHFSPRYADMKPYESRIRKIFPRTVFAYDGLTLEL
ncbi:MAG: ribonuclease Z [Candidatus Micrarchaeota archaeon]